MGADVWAAIAAISAALAALASCAAIGLDLWRQRRAHVPEIRAVLGRDEEKCFVTITNAGPGYAFRVTMIGLTAGGVEFEGGIREGNLAPSQTSTVDIGVPIERLGHGDQQMLWLCHDTRGTIHWWTLKDGRGTASTDETLDGLFVQEYPESAEAMARAQAKRQTQLARLVPKSVSDS